MARPEYPSDEKRRKTKPAARIHLSVPTHPKMAPVYGDNELFATWTRILLAASRAHAGKTGDRLTFSRAACAEFAGRASAVNGLRTIRRLCALLQWTISEHGASITIHIRNFARKQGFDSAARGVNAEYDSTTPAASESESESESESKRESSLPTLSPRSQQHRREEPLSNQEPGSEKTDDRGDRPPPNGSRRNGSDGDLMHVGPEMAKILSGPTTKRTPNDAPEINPKVRRVVELFRPLATRYGLKAPDVDPLNDPAYYANLCARIVEHPDLGEWERWVAEIEKQPSLVGKGTPAAGETIPWKISLQWAVARSENWRRVAIRRWGY